MAIADVKRTHAAFIRGALLLPGMAALAAFAGLALLAHGSGPLPGDLDIERFVQSISWGPSSTAFGWVTAFNGQTQFLGGMILLALIIVISPRTFLFAALASLSGTLYTVTNSLVDRPRPSADLVTVTEHLGARSFPSGHAVFALTYVTLLVLCVAGKYLSRRQLIVVAGVGAVVVAFMSVGRLVTGGHWPSDVYGGLLLAGGWMLILLAVRPIGHPVLAWLGDPAGRWQAHHPGLPNTMASRRRLVERAFYTPIVQLLERFGFMVRGLLWVIVGAALIASAFGLGAQLDIYGSVQILLSNPWQGVAAGVILIGIGGYAIWGYVRTIFDPLRRGRSASGLLARLGFLSSAVSYTLVVVFTLGLTFGGAGGSTSSAFDPAAMANFLASYGAVYVLAAIVVGIGVSQAIDGWREPFTHDVLIEAAPHGALFRVWTWMGRAGLWARAVLFAFLGVLILVEQSAGLPWSTSFSHAFSGLGQLPGGPEASAILGIGLIALGLHSFGAARWMRLRPPVIERRVHEGGQRWHG